VIENGKIFKIGWDLDGVTVDSWKPVMQAANSKLSLLLGKPINITKQEITSWDAISRIVIGLTSDPILAKQLEANWFDPQILRQAEPNLAMLDVIQRCQELPDTEQFAITTRPPACAPVTIEWLDYYIPGIDWSTRLHIRQEGSSLGSEAFKIGDIMETGINFMSEDHTPTVIRMMTDINHPLFDFNYVTQPWNESDTDNNRGRHRVPCEIPDIAMCRILTAREQFFASV
jgi:hypothetical protein